MRCAYCRQNISQYFYVKKAVCNFSVYNIDIELINWIFQRLSSCHAMPYHAVLFKVLLRNCFPGQLRMRKLNLHRNKCICLRKKTQLQKLFNRNEAFLEPTTEWKRTFNYFQIHFLHSNSCSWLCILKQLDLLVETTGWFIKIVSNTLRTSIYTRKQTHTHT